MGYNYHDWVVKRINVGKIELRKCLNGSTNVLIKVYKKPTSEFDDKKPNKYWYPVNSPKKIIHLSANGKLIMTEEEFLELGEVVNNAILELSENLGDA